MLVDIVIPELGESITEGTVTGWLVEAGQQVEEDQPLLQLDTDKVSVDVPSPAAGVLKERLVEEGEDVEVGAVVGRIDTEAQAAAGGAEATKEEAPKEQTEARKKQAEPPPESAKQPARAAQPQTPVRAVEERARPAASGAGAGAAQATAGGEAPRARGERAGARSEAGRTEAQRPQVNGGNGNLSPAVRRMVREHEVDVERLEGTGPHGRVRPEDVVHYLEGREAPAPRGEAAPARARGETPSVPEAGEVERPLRRVPMTRLRRRIAQRLKEVQDTAAILTTFNEVDMTEVMALRRRYKERFQKAHGVKLGVMSFFVKAAIEALKAYPAVNGYIDGEDIVYNDFYDIGVAVSTERGLVVPVLRDADRLGFADIEKGIADLAKAARDGTLTLDQLSGGTFSITNGGIFGSMLSTPILNPPQSGILGMHAINERPVAVDGKVEIRPMMYLALSYDHRLVDGAEAVRFLVKIKEALEDPGRLLLDL